MEVANQKDEVEIFPFPPCWNDNDRMRVLFAPFRPRDVNPENYDSKMIFWQKLIAKYCQFMGSAIFSIRLLKNAFVRYNKSPECLPAVIAELQKQKKIRLFKDYEYDPLNSWSGWAMTSFVKHPLSWGWYKVKSTLGADLDYPEQLNYVHLDIIEDFMFAIEKEILPNHEGEVLHFDGFANAVVEQLQLNDESLELCLITLHLKRKIGLEYSPNTAVKSIHLIKIPSKTNPDIAITEYDHAVHNLQKTQQNLNTQLEVLEKEINEQDTKVRAYMKENKRALAKNALRKKHMLEKRFEKRSIALNNIEELLHSVYETQSSGTIIDAYKIGSKALQKVLKDSGLTYDNVDEVIFEVRDAIESHKEVEDTISNANVTNNLVTDTDLEKELQQIINDEKSAEKSNPHKLPAGAIVINNSNMPNNNVYDTLSKGANLESLEDEKDKSLLEMLNNLQVLEDSISVSNENVKFKEATPLN